MAAEPLMLGAPPKNYEVLPKTGRNGDVPGDLLEVAMGPHHPSTHGVFRMDVVLDGERVVKLKPVFGYLHRNHEKIAENTTYLGSMPYTDRLDYFCSLTNNWAYALAVEKLAGLQVPERAEYIRVITAELTRLQNHASLAGFLLQDMGASGTPLMYAFREREKILDLFESLTGARMMCNYMRFGGCRVDLPAGWLEAAKRVTDDFPRFVDEYERLLSENEILATRQRLEGIGIDTAPMSDEDIQKIALDRARSFRDEAPTSAAQAAKVILDGVKAERWRILVGDDAHKLDARVRKSPEEAYTPEFYQSYRDEAGWRIG